VNPFLLNGRSDVIQLFDRAVLSEYLPPYTMMTNAGDLSWGIEFRPAELVAYLSNARVEDFAAPASQTETKPPVLGILTGNGPESGMELWRRINTAVREGSERLRGDINYPSVVVVSLPGMGMSMELAHREGEVLRTVLGGIDSLADAGATVIGIACNTTQYFSGHIRARCAERGATFISLVDSVRAELQRHGATSFNLIGIGPVANLEKWSDFRRLEGEFDILPPTVREVSTITDLAWEVKAKEDKTGNRSQSKLRHVLSSGTSTGTALIALTELSVALMEHPKIKNGLEESGKLVIDTLTALARGMAGHYLSYRRTTATD
jgi:aspartate/glutamate racemase